MPELPETQTIANDIKKELTGYKITLATIDNSYNIYPNSQEFLKQIVNKEIIGAHRYAKNIVVELSENKFIIFHLAMSGKLLLKQKGSAEDKWTKIILYLQKGKIEKELRFTDMRTFGKAGIYSKKEYEIYKQKYGPDPLDNQFTHDHLFSIIKSKNTNIKNLLLDQTKISGIGNIYATDALFLAGISPKTPTKNFNEARTKKLYVSLKKILNEGIFNRGSTMQDKLYLDLYGNPGKQQDNFKVFQREICIRCGNEITYEKLNGRGTYYCKVCQK